MIRKPIRKLKRKKNKIVYAVGVGTLTAYFIAVVKRWLEM